MARVTTSVRLEEGINSLARRAGYEPVDADGVNHNQDGTPIWGKTRPVLESTPAC